MRNCRALDTIVSKQQNPIRRSSILDLIFSCIPWIVPAENRIHDEEQERFNNAGNEFDMLPTVAMEEVLKELLERLPEEEKDASLKSCFNRLYCKLPEKSRKEIDAEVTDILSASQGAATEGEVITQPNTVVPAAYYETSPTGNRRIRQTRPKTVG